MKRRDFVKLSSLLTASAALPFGSLSAWPKGKIYHIGILGYGDRGSGLHKVLNNMPDKFLVKGVCDDLPLRLENARKNYPSGVQFHQDYRKLLEQKDLDIILVATPLYLHFEHAKAVLDAGKHLFLEKTMVFNVDQAIELNSLKKKHTKQVIQIGHQYRYSPLYFRVKEMIQNGWLGDVTQIEARWDRNHNWRRPVPNADLERKINWRMYREYSGGLVAELLSHQMDFIHWAFETQPSSIYGVGGIDHFKDGRETFDNVQVTLRYEKEGMVGNFGATCANQHDGYSFKIKGSRGMVSLLTNEGIFYPEPDTRSELEEVDGVSGATRLVWSNDKKGVKILDQPTRDGSYYALEDFYRCLVEKDLPHSNTINGGKTAIAVALANESIYTGKKMEWKPEFDLV
ncbi:Gfo/Idh/MocA family protein [Cecembia calidifontis]|uniref:Putative dehydrogenase n=1 Tax=Cecembia calidifontis TaxID=1187080 RepID=A0A4Q7PBU9_9BACT|nr:Gfo/Idh/MocA family oxidoreductase [Cecembia calidifontis]RZS97487.1 putative dehydrogenase [Cecembia calidifontis]